MNLPVLVGTAILSLSDIVYQDFITTLIVWVLYITTVPISTFSEAFGSQVVPGAIIYKVIRILSFNPTPISTFSTSKPSAHLRRRVSLCVYLSLSVC